MAFFQPARGGEPGPRPSYAQRSSARSRALLLTLAVLVMLGMAVVMGAGAWTDWLWYRSLHYTSVLLTTLRVRLVLFAVFGLVMAAGVAGNAYLAHRLRPVLSAMSAEQRGLDRYRLAIAGVRGRLLLAISVLLGTAAGAAAADQWRLWLAYANAVPFGTRDPQFHRDVAFYTFQLPWYRFLLSFAFAAVVLWLLTAVLVHYLYGGLRATGPEPHAGPAATGHLAVLLGLFVALKAVAYWLDRSGLAVTSGNLAAAPGWTGLRYVDADAYLPAKTCLFCIALICSALFFATLWRRTWSLPLLGLGLMALSAVLIGGLYPVIVQRFQVRPHEAAKEAPYLQRGIEATRAAYGIAGTQVTGSTGTSGGAGGTSGGTAGGTSGAAPATAGGTAAARAVAGAAALPVLDADVVAPAFRAMQQGSGAYTVCTPLAVDRYPVDGVEQQVVVGAREVDADDISGRSWTEDHLVHTHGYGVVAAPADSATPDGAPRFSGSESSGVLGAYQPRIYYGEQESGYAIAGGPAAEADGPSGAAGYHYTGGGGVSLSDPLTRAAYAVRFGQPRILLSQSIGRGSRILYDRTPQQRVAAAAPWLTVDGDPYPAVVDGHLDWIVDGYTTSDDYPYAARSALPGAAGGQDAGAASTTGGRQVNYVRESVVATVDAFSGKVTLYQWDTADPVLRTWMRAFPGTVRPRAAVPAALLPHLRYPQTLFTLQQEMLARYHVTDPAAFYRGDDAWQVPKDPVDQGAALPPSYLSLSLPGASGPTFALGSVLTSAGSGDIGAFMEVDADPTSSGYGRITLVTPPPGAALPGPRRTQSGFEADPAVAARISQLTKDGSAVEYGDPLAVPLGGAALWVEPVYVRGAGSGYPLLKGVLAAYGKAVALEPTLPAALDAVLGETASGEESAALTAAGLRLGGASAVRQELTAAQRAFAAGQRDLKAGDWAAYARDQQALDQALERARQADGVAGGDG